ncbi:MAG: helicase HerA domain-containing protein [Gemmatimonadota bacterium]
MIDEVAAEAERLFPAEQLVVDFYAWERRGRGWWIWPEPVELEPPFRPFVLRRLAHGRQVDDARKHTLLSRFVAFLAGRTSPESVVPTHAEEDETEEPWPETDDGEEALTELSVTLPPDLEVTPNVAAQMLASLPPHLPMVGFEVLGTHEGIALQWTVSEGDASALQHQLLAHFPDIGIQEASGTLVGAWEGPSEGHSLIVDIGLANEFLLPLSAPSSFKTDPLVGIVGALEDLQEGEVGLLQVLFHRVRHPWAGSMRRAAKLFEDSGVQSLMRDKVSESLFATVVRIAARTVDPERTWAVNRALMGALGPLARSDANELIPLSNADYVDGEHEEDLLARRTHRSGMLLNLRELTSLVHLPSPAVGSRRLGRERRSTMEAPVVAQGPGLVLGENVHRGRTTVVHLPATHRLRHVHVVGATGTGKSHLLLQLILQDIESGTGVGVLDPHGDLIDRILERIPESRHDDVVLLDPSDAQGGVPKIV